MELRTMGAVAWSTVAMLLAAPPAFAQMNNSKPAEEKAQAPSSAGWGDSPGADTGAPDTSASEAEGWSDGKAAPVRSTTDPTATDPRFIKPGRFGPIAFPSTLPAILVAYVPSYAFVIGGGLGLTYDMNGIPGPTGPTPDKLAGTVFLLAELMLINEGPFAMGPELMFQGSIAPGAFLSRKAISGGVCWWFAPWWNAPVLIGGAWHTKVSIISGLGTIVELQTPSVRFGFLWN